MTSLFPVVTGLALLDSLNPFAVAAMAYLLGTVRPLRSGAVFVAATFAVYLLVGVLLLEGWLLAFAYLVPLLPAWVIGGLQIALGGLLILWGLKPAAETGEPQSAIGTRIGAVALFAGATTAADATTAAPYFVAVHRIAAEGGDPVAQGAWLGWYSLLYVLPLIVMLALALAMRDRAATLFGPLRRGVDWMMRKLFPPLLVLAGLVLMVDGTRRIILAAGDAP